MSIAEITDNINKLNKDVGTFRQLTDQIGTKKDTSKSREQLRDLRENIKEMAKLIKTELQRANEDRSNRQKVDQLSKSFAQILSLYDQTSKTSIQKEREFVVQMESRRDSSPINMQVSPKQQQQVADFKELNVDDELIKEYNTDIKSLESDLLELQTVFNDVGLLVDQQGQMLDNVETNVASADNNVVVARGKLSDAMRLATSARWKIVAIIVLIVVILAIIIIVIVVPICASKKC